MPTITFAKPKNAFYRELNKKVDAYFAKNRIKSTGNFQLYFKTIVLLSSAIITYFSVLFLQLPPVALLALCALEGFIFAGITFNVMHDAAHGSFSNKKWINETVLGTSIFIGVTSDFWKVSHNHLHHTFTNIDGADEDIEASPWMRIHKSQPRYSYHSFQHLYALPLYGIGMVIWIFLTEFKKYFSKQGLFFPMPQMDFKGHFMFWFSKIMHVALFIMVPAFKFGILKALLGYFVMSYALSVTLQVFFQLAHVVMDTQFFISEHEEKKVDQDWATYQIATTSNFATKNPFVTWYSGGLNFQIEHHLFPKISHVHYPAINQMVQELCKKFNLNYIEYPTLFKAIGSHLSHLRSMGKSQLSG